MGMCHMKNVNNSGCFPLKVSFRTSDKITAFFHNRWPNSLSPCNGMTNTAFYWLKPDKICFLLRNLLGNCETIRQATCLCLMSVLVVIHRLQLVVEDWTKLTFDSLSSTAGFEAERRIEMKTIFFAFEFKIKCINKILCLFSFFV